MRTEKSRESFDTQLANLAPEARMLWLVYGDREATNPAVRLAAQARAVKGLAKVLGARFEPTLSEGYRAACAELQRFAGECYVQALLRKDASFFARSAAEARRIDCETPRPSAAHTIRLILMSEVQAGPVNLTRLSAGLKEFWGITINASSLGRIAHRLDIATLSKGRPKKSAH